MGKSENIKVVVVADGSFPVHKVPLGFLAEADIIVCCDGSAGKVVGAGFIPNAIVGDMDSLTYELKERFSDRIYEEKEQETNDLTKAVRWCRTAGYNEIIIIGATGMREDHTIGNISLLAEYMGEIKVKMVTDYGIFIPINDSCIVDCVAGQQVSIFSMGEDTVISSDGLKYPLKERVLKNWWEATLNEAVADSFRITFSGGPVIIYLNHQNK